MSYYMYKLLLTKKMISVIFWCFWSNFIKFFYIFMH